MQNINYPNSPLSFLPFSVESFLLESTIMLFVTQPRVQSESVQVFIVTWKLQSCWCRLQIIVFQMKKQFPELAWGGCKWHAISIFSSHLEHRRSCFWFQWNTTVFATRGAFNLLEAVQSRISIDWWKAKRTRAPSIGTNFQIADDLKNESARHPFTTEWALSKLSKGTLFNKNASLFPTLFLSEAAFPNPFLPLLLRFY